MVLHSVKRKKAVDEDLQFLLPLIFSEQHFHVKNSHLYWLKHEELGDWLEMTKRLVERWRLSVSSWGVPLIVRNQLEERHQGGLTFQLVENDENEDLWLRRRVWYAYKCFVLSLQGFETRNRSCRGHKYELKAW